MLGAGESVLRRGMIVHVFLMCQEGVGFPYRGYGAVAPMVFPKSVRGKSFELRFGLRQAQAERDWRPLLRQWNGPALLRCGLLWELWR